MQDARRAAAQAEAGGDEAPLVPVDSCFGGLALYRYEALRGCRYAYRHPAEPAKIDCEHVLFHLCLAERRQAAQAAQAAPAAMTRPEKAHSLVRPLARPLAVVSNPLATLWYGHSPV